MARLTPKGRPSWAQVVRVLPTPETRASVIDALRAQGFSPDDVGMRNRADEVCAAAITAVEDRLELFSSKVNRAALKLVRRALEGGG
jgi:hypothetical protein